MKRTTTIPVADDGLIDLRDEIIGLTLADPVAARYGDPLRIYRRLGWWMAIGDALVVMAAFFLAGLPQTAGPARPFDISLASWIAPPLFVAIFASSRLYAIHRYPVAEEFRRLVTSITLGVAAVIIVSFWSRVFSRDWIVVAWLLSVSFVLIERWVWHLWLARSARQGRLVFRTLVVGAKDDAEKLAHILRQGETGFKPVGVVTDDEGRPPTGDTPILGNVAGTRHWIESTKADCVVIARGSLSLDQMSIVAKAARQAGVEMRVSTDLPQVLPGRVTVQSVGGLITLALHPVKLTGFQARLKRTSDIIGASFGLLAAAPVMAVVAILITSTSKGPILFRQRRVTKGGRSFTIYKFRTMVVDAAGRLRERSVDTQAPFFKAYNDDLVTPIGRHLRRLSLDELPQLWNVLKGDMSLVGPRPLPEEQVIANQELLGPRHELRAGLTGWWQVNGRSDISPEEAVRQDLFFIENWSLSLDIWILFKTLGVLVHARGAY